MHPWLQSLCHFAPSTSTVLLPNGLWHMDLVHESLHGSFLLLLPFHLALPLSRVVPDPGPEQVLCPTEMGVHLKPFHQFVKHIL